MDTVICDTSVWYHISNGIITKDKLENKHLVLTNVSVREISYSPHLTKRMDLIVRVIRTMHENHKIAIPYNPWDHIIKLFHPSFVGDTKSFDKSLNGFNVLLANFPHLNISTSTIDVAQSQIDEIRCNLSSISEHFNNGLEEIRAKINIDSNKQKHRNTSFRLDWKRFFSNWVSNYSKQYNDEDFVLDIHSPVWEKLEFFLAVWEEFFKQLEVDKTGIITQNDWADILNMVYVQPWCKFWIREKKWHNIFSQNPFFSRYVIPYEG